MIYCEDQVRFLKGCALRDIEDFVQLRLMCLGISYSHPVISPSRISSLLFFFIPQLLKSGSRFSRNIGKVEAWNLIGCDLFAVGQIEGECERMLNLYYVKFYTRSDLALCV
ncbi:uncharacterized protein LOC112203255 [Rosa chinensis]|uniref:uncharacterized protein LOC112203255 n=1 Tax=Rosa chinensis TaxID=74649 RepID=UPI001AD94854|nr:uncharacterized protein LOC112203255 [Rosa chinensis]